MIRLVAHALLMALIVGPAAAAPLTLRSGEHDGFSRLVLPLPVGAVWSLTPQSGRTVLRITGAATDFDTSGVFDRIPRTRLTGLVANDVAGTLTLELGCDCPVRGFPEGNRFLVIDIADPPLPVSTRSLPSQPRFRFGNLPAAKPGTPDMAMGMPVLSGPLPPRPDPLDPTTAVNGLPDMRSAGIAERRLIDQILRASEQGLLDLQQVPEVSANPSTAPKSGPNNMAFSTALESDQASQPTNDPGTAEKCPENGPAVGEWGADTPVPALLARYRSALFSEFDRPDPIAVRALAQSYLYLGFGAEARPVLALAGLPDAPVLQALSWLVDGEPVGPLNPFHGQQHCDGDVAIWAALAEPIEPGRVDRAAVLRGFARLPAHLRAHLGPILADRFTDSGDRQTAEAVLRAATRPGGDPNPAALVAAARTDGMRDDHDAAEAKLETVVASGSDQAPRALIALVAAKWQARDTVDPDLPDLIAAYALERRQGGLGPALRHTHALALALAGRFDPAMAAVAEVSTRDGTRAETATLTPVLVLMTAGADDITFLRHTLPSIEAGKIPISEDTVDPMARRLLDLGFADAAGHLLATAPDAATSEARRLLRAEAALDQGLPHRAMVELLGLDGAEPARMRARAMAQTGDFAAFADYMQRAGDSDAAARGFWLAGATESTPDGDGRYERIAGLSERIAAGNPDEAALPPLAQARALLDNSRALRDDIGALLDRTTDAASKTDPDGQ
jgi:hypothetical protein